MQDYLKFLRKLPKTLRIKVIAAIDKIAGKALSTYHNLYRCRVGRIRILFQKRDGKNYILDIGFRGEIYKNFLN